MNNVSDTGDRSRWADFLSRLSILLAYLGGLVISAIGLISAVSIIGRSAISHPIMGDFELVEIGTAVAGSLFLPYCQATKGHIVVDFFTLRMRPAALNVLDRIGNLLLAIMFFVVGWRTFAGCISVYRSGEISMLLGFPIWLGYAITVPGVIVAGTIALAQTFGVALEAGSRECD
jgi:TRAP-type C4-dicarboxylate transport system permease small subunit